MKVNCIYCGYPNFSDAEICRKCKRKMPTLCPSCGAPLSEGAKFCSKCGNIFEQDKVDTETYLKKSLSKRQLRGKQEFKPHKYTVRTCPECNNSVSTEAMFCTSCGHVFESVDKAKKKIRVRAEEAEVLGHQETPLELDEIVSQPPSDIVEPMALEDVVIPGVRRVKVENKKRPVPEVAPIQKEQPQTPGDEKEDTLRHAEELARKHSLSFDGDDEEDVPEGMVMVPGGPFPTGNGLMQQLVDEFLIDIYPVTNGQFQKYLQETGGQPPADWLDGHPLSGKDDHPVINVSLKEAEAYAKWAGKRLPTGLEWEKAARGVDGLVYPWGNEFNAAALNSRESQFNTTTAVDRYADYASPYGVCDIVGNVCEWVKQNDDGSVQFRGGSFLDDKANVKTTSKFVTSSPNFKSFFIGFRCAKDTW